MLLLRPFLNRLLCLAALLTSATTSVAADSDTSAEIQKVRQKAVQFLKLSQSSDGSWTSPDIPGITGLAVYALLESGVPVDDAAVARGLTFLESLRHDDGGIYYAKSNHRNYETSIALLAFAAASQDGRYDRTIRQADRFLRGLQWDEDEDQKPEDPGYGGAGYGGHQRPDLSNTTFLIEALKTAGAAADDPAMQKALAFVSRCQNLESEHNNTPFAARINDGGFYYTPAAGGTSQAGKTPAGGLRSYASMTYAGLKSMIYAGVKRDDPRVKAALAWIRKFYSLEENPGMGLQGLFYYYHTFAKSLSVLNIDELEDASGRKHNWRRELVEKLAATQKANGSWVNQADRWYEGDPNLVTAYALLALAHCD